MYKINYISVYLLPAGGHKMYHPSIYVLVTDLDDMEEMEAAASQKCPLGTSSSAEAAALAALSSANQTAGSTNTNNNNNNNNIDTRKPLMENFSNNKLPSATTTINGTKSSLDHMVEHLKIDRTKVQPYYDTQTRNFTCNTTNIHAPPQAACEMPERAWQDCVTNVLHVQHTLNGTISNSNSTTTSSSASASSTTSNVTSSNTSSSTTTTTTTPSSSSTTTAGNNNENATGNENSTSVSGGGGGNGIDQTDNSVDIKPNTTTLSQKQQQQQIWGFVDPTQKAPCICTK